MAWIRRIRNLYELLFQREKKEADLDAEVSAYFEILVDRYVAQGLSKEEARRMARVKFEGPEQVKHKVREARAGATVEATLKDVRYAARILRRSPAFAAVIVFTLALGIGANTAIFSIVQAVLLRPLPYREPSRLVLTFEAPVHDKESEIFVSYRHFLEWTKKSHSYQDMAAETWVRGPRFMLGRGAPQSILAVPVSVDFFSVLGVPPQLGRTFTRDDLSLGCAVVLGHSFWQTRLGGQAGIVGRRLALDDSSCTVIGVMPPSFVFFPVPSEMWTLITPASELDRNPDRNGVAVIGRLKPGVSRASAEAELRLLARAIDQGRDFGVETEPISFDLQQEFTWLAGRNLRLSLLVLLGAVILVLLIACVNVANLLLGRSLVRQREFAIRTAIGSGRARLVRQLLTESLLLSVSAAFLGCWIAVGVVHWFTISNPVELPPGATLSVNIPVLGFAAGLALLTTLLFGFVPAWHASKVSINEALKSGGRSSGGPSRQRLAKGLIAAEITFSLVLLAVAGLLIQSIANFGSAPLGFVPDRLITMTLSLPPVPYAKPEQRAAFYDRVKSGVLALPGVEGVGMSSHIALKGSSSVSAVTVEGRPSADPKRVILDTEQQYITEGYLRLMGIPVERGREFAWEDGGEAPPVAVVNVALVRKYFPAEDPLGEHIRFAGPEDANPWLTIVGVSGDEKQSTPFQEMAWAEPPIVYRPLAQRASATVDLVVRVSSLETLGGAAIQRNVLKLGQDLRISDVYPMRHVRDRYTAYPRFRAILMGAFAGLALLLAVVGLYGVLSQLVVQRTQEIGIRMALGAQRKDVLRLVMQQGMLLAGIGAGLGILAALLLARFMRSLLYGVRPADPVTLAGVSLILVLASALATYIPARRATRVNPIDSLRSE